VTLQRVALLAPSYVSNYRSRHITYIKVLLDTAPKKKILQENAEDTNRFSSLSNTQITEYTLLKTLCFGFKMDICVSYCSRNEDRILTDYCLQ
jgi:hypothetical protein